jgi:RNA polymerase sigma-70 factor, ECF subfamily
MSIHEWDFPEVHAAFKPRIHRYLARLIGEDQAEDLTQEVFIRVSQGLGDFRGESSLSTWIYRIATNAALDLLRSREFKQGDILSIDDDLAPDLDSILEDHNPWTGEKAPQLEAQAIKRYLSECLGGFIQKLPQDYRTVMVLSELERLSNKEIAGILGISLPTVKIRLHRARARLKDDLLNNCEYYWAEEMP